MRVVVRSEWPYVTVNPRRPWWLVVALVGAIVSAYLGWNFRWQFGALAAVATIATEAVVA